LYLKTVYIWRYAISAFQVYKRLNVPSAKQKLKV
jgi:hypothetical protein